MGMDLHTIVLAAAGKEREEAVCCQGQHTYGHLVRQEEVIACHTQNSSPCHCLFVWGSMMVWSRKRLALCCQEQWPCAHPMRKETCVLLGEEVPVINNSPSTKANCINFRILSYSQITKWSLYQRHIHQLHK